MSASTEQEPEGRDAYEIARHRVIHLEDAIFSLSSIEPEVVKYLKGKLEEARLRCDAEKKKIEIDRHSLRYYIKSRRSELAGKYVSFFNALQDRDGRECKQCHSGLDLTIDHVKPLAEWGTNDLNNLQILCRSCNSKKWRTYHE